MLLTAIFRELRRETGLSSEMSDVLIRFVYGTHLIVTLSGFLNCVTILPIMQQSKQKITFIAFAMKRYLRVSIVEY